ncbi:hypothetical protein BKA80DRAFT_276673 [Phyllosticta citrichinensis]
MARRLPRHPLPSHCRRRIHDLGRRCGRHAGSKRANFAPGGDPCDEVEGGKA